MTFEIDARRLDGAAAFPARRIVPMSGRTDSIDREQGQITARDIELELEI